MEKKRETLTEKTIRILTTVHRPFIICIDGIWREVSGVYVWPLSEPYKIKYILNGVEFGSDTSKAIDVYGYNENWIENNVVQRNLESFPPVKKQDLKMDNILWDAPAPPVFYNNDTPRMGHVFTRNARRIRERLVPVDIEPELPPITTAPIFMEATNL
jgi:hypothetical protein